MRCLKPKIGTGPILKGTPDHLPNIWMFTQFAPLPLGNGSGGGGGGGGEEGQGVGAEPFFRTFIQKGLKSNQDFGWELLLQVGVVFSGGT